MRGGESFFGLVEVGFTCGGSSSSDQRIPSLNGILGELFVREAAFFDVVDVASDGRLATNEDNALVCNLEAGVVEFEGETGDPKPGSSRGRFD